ncbi:hypothetical protein Ccrd_000963 [Cynara cardunculus var. scolymus]|uniref:Uncharacterized protein n=1 Tax=Cynara cardunculus var. scolymus TaxID=59895 RepID=A0A103XU66_CYNCS|nr:hypothetical protein Ccrd_000963 [Cynara cardunculus var. scolymus]
MLLPSLPTRNRSCFLPSFLQKLKSYRSTIFSRREKQWSGLLDWKLEIKQIEDKNSRTMLEELGVALVQTGRRKGRTGSLLLTENNIPKHINPPRRGMKVDTKMQHFDVRQVSKFYDFYCWFCSKITTIIVKLQNILQLMSLSIFPKL